MGFFPIPIHSFRDITDITPGFLEKLGVELVMLDLDNTIASYAEHDPAERVSQWVNLMKQTGFKLFIISNSSRTKRVETFSKALEIEYIMKSGKPSPESVLKAMEITGLSADVSVLVGDQIFTDTLAAKRSEVTSIIVRPRSIKNPLLALRYVIELPFRLACKNIHS